MYTAQQIADKLDVRVYRVRYVLTQLRKKHKIESLMVGQTHAYPDATLHTVRQILAKRKKTP